MPTSIHIGTSGWSYKHWYGPFYPEDLTFGTELEFYTKQFNTVEINSTFYHLPKVTTWQGWTKRTPPNFIFSVKGSRFISHVLKLDNVRDPFSNLISSAKLLGKKLGPILFQFPDYFRADHDRLQKFCHLDRPNIRLALEFRHPSWFTSKTYNLLKDVNVALVIADSPDFPQELKYTADFVYLRLHGSQKFKESKYTQEELKTWASKINRWKNKGQDVFIYFNNDSNTHAVENAKELKELIK